MPSSRPRSSNRSRPTREHESARPSGRWEKVREAARALPGIEEGSAYGTVAIRVKGKFLARLKEDGESLAIRVQMVERDQLMQSHPRTFYITDHYRDYPAVLIHLSKVKPRLLRELVEAAWRRATPKRMVAEYDRSTSIGRQT